MKEFLLSFLGSSLGFITTIIVIYFKNKDLKEQIKATSQLSKSNLITELINTNKNQLQLLQNTNNNLEKQLQNSFDLIKQKRLNDRIDLLVNLVTSLFENLNNKFSLLEDLAYKKIEQNNFLNKYKKYLLEFDIIDFKLKTTLYRVGIDQKTTTIIIHHYNQIISTIDLLNKEDLNPIKFANFSKEINNHINNFVNNIFPLINNLENNKI